MTKKINILLLFCFLVLSSGAFAQNQEKGKHSFEKFRVEREAFLRKSMDINDEQAKAFFPICDELQMKKFELNKELRDERRKMRESKKKGETISEEFYKKFIELRTEVKLKEALLDKEYLSKFMEVLPAEKVYLYQHAEQEFGKKMAENRKKNRKG